MTVLIGNYIIFPAFLSPKESWNHRSSTPDHEVDLVRCHAPNPVVYAHNVSQCEPQGEGSASRL
eukprot:5942620-Amphidinium_carterae.1